MYCLHPHDQAVLISKDKGTTDLLHVRSNQPKDTVSHPKRLQTSFMNFISNWSITLLMAVTKQTTGRKFPVLLCSLKLEYDYSLPALKYTFIHMQKSFTDSSMHCGRNNSFNFKEFDNEHYLYCTKIIEVQNCQTLPFLTTAVESCLLD